LNANGASHTIAHAFLFPGRDVYQPTDGHCAIQPQMVGFWSRSAKSGNPNGSDDPLRPAVTPDNYAYLEIGAETSAKKGPDTANCDFWYTVTFIWPHL
jgi:hypothetical protein